MFMAICLGCNTHVHTIIYLINSLLSFNPNFYYLITNYPCMTLTMYSHIHVLFNVNIMCMIVNIVLFANNRTFGLTKINHEYLAACSSSEC